MPSKAECNTYVIESKGCDGSYPLTATVNPSELLKSLRESITIFLYLFDLLAIDAEKATDVIYGGKAIGKTVPNTDTTGAAWDRNASCGAGKIGIRYPKIELALQYENAETDLATTLDYKLIAELKADPLLGVGLELDILSAIVKIGMNTLLPGSTTVLEAGKQFASFIWEIINDPRAKAAAIKQTTENIENRQLYFEAGMSLVMKVGASVGCGGKWEKQLGQPEGGAVVDPSNVKSAYSAAANASLDFILEGKVYVKGKVFMVMFEAGLMVALGSAKAAEAAKVEFKFEFNTVGGKPNVDGAVEWNGLAFLFASYINVGVKAKDNADDDDDDNDDLTAAPKLSTNKTEAELAVLAKKNAHQWVLIEPGKFPEDPKTPLDQYARL